MFNIIIFLFLCFFFCSCRAAEIEEPKKLFKIGLELQESNHLCPWGIDEESVQNIPIFSVQKGDRHLWDITIDWQDLEFVTSPFSNLEEKIFDSAIESIHIACDVLVQLSSGETIGKVTFKKWQVQLQKKLDENFPSEYFVTFTYQGNAGALGSLIPATGAQFTAAKFQPQVTIQHKLTQTIPLILGLCSSSLTAGLDGFCLELSEKTGISRDNIEVLINRVIKDCFSSKINESQQFIIEKKTPPEEGFLFLHILTCLSLVANIDPTPDERSRVEGISYQYFNKGGQVNAKAFLGVLSRRPFSMMWQEIRTAQSYASLVERLINEEFKQFLFERFQYINYGELYFNRDGSRLNLTPYFPDLVDGDTNQTLLENGVLSTSMLRQISSQAVTMKNVFSDYFDKVIASIDSVDSQYYDIDSDTAGIRQQAITHDLLSPPHFSSTYNSMGAYKTNENHDSGFGEAVLEFRMIADLGRYACNVISEETGIDIAPSEFLSKVYQKKIPALQNQTKGLFLLVKTLLELGDPHEI